MFLTWIGTLLKKMETQGKPLPAASTETEPKPAPVMAPYIFQTGLKESITFRGRILFETKVIYQYLTWRVYVFERENKNFMIVFTSHTTGVYTKYYTCPNDHEALRRIILSNFSDNKYDGRWFALYMEYQPHVTKDLDA